MAPEDDMRVRRRENVLSTTSADETLLVDQITGSVHVVNTTAGRIWELCADEPSVEELVEGVAGTYGLELDEIRDDVREMVRTFAELGVVELLPAR